MNEELQQSTNNKISPEKIITAIVTAEMVSDLLDEFQEVKVHISALEKLRALEELEELKLRELISKNIGIAKVLENKSETDIKT